MKRISLSILVLTRDEESNLPHLLESVSDWVQNIFIVDSGSTDRTLPIAESFNAKVLYNPWLTYATQFNWGLENFDIQTDWVMRMDADERITPDLARELNQLLPTLATEITGLYVKRRVYFMGHWIKYGGMYPTWMLRVFRKHKAYCEDRHMDEHMVLTEGATLRLNHDIIDENHKGLKYFTIKHEDYARREMLDMLHMTQETNNNSLKASLLKSQPERKRLLKGSVYSHLPLFWRAIGYFAYRYIFRLGFLDGTEGLMFHVLQGLWYRFYVDAKLWEVQHKEQRG